MSFVSSNTLSPYPSKLSFSASLNKTYNDINNNKEVKLCYFNKPSTSLADKLTGHFDRDWKENKSILREETLRHKAYHPAHSWEARSDNPQEFSKLQFQELPVQPSRPVTLIGAQVVLLDKSPDMRVFNYGVPVPASANKTLPLTMRQQDIGMTSGIVDAKIPMQEEALAAGSRVLIPRDCAFNTYKVRPPEFKLQKMPSCYERAGINGDQVLLNPAQRKAIMVFDAESQRGSKYVKDAMYQRLKLREAVTGPIYHRGVLIYDMCDNLDSEIYRDKAEGIHYEVDRKQRGGDARAAKLVENSVHLNKDFGELVSSSAKQESLFEQKGGVHATLSLQETQNRLFERSVAYIVDPGRLQALRNQSTKGRNYNILTHTTIEHVPSTGQEQVYKHMAHPSQNSHNSSRNHQGSLVPDCTKVHCLSTNYY